MKAREYFKLFVEDVTLSPGEPGFVDAFQEALARTMAKLMLDAREVMEVRKAKSDSAVMAVLRETRLKYISFASKVNALYSLDLLTEDGFEKIVSKVMYIDIMGDSQ